MIIYARLRWVSFLWNHQLIKNSTFYFNCDKIKKFKVFGNNIGAINWLNFVTTLNIFLSFLVKLSLFIFFTLFLVSYYCFFLILSLCTYSYRSSNYSNSNSCPIPRSMSNTFLVAIEKSPIVRKCTISLVIGHITV